MREVKITKEQVTEIFSSHKSVTTDRFPAGLSLLKRVLFMQLSSAYMGVLDISRWRN
jgi:hypothetical protein